MTDLLWYHVTCDDAGTHREWEIKARGIEEALDLASIALREDWNGPAHLVAARTRKLPATTPRLERLEKLAAIVGDWIRQGERPLAAMITIASEALESDRP